MSILQDIISFKKHEVLEASKRLPLDVLKQKSRFLPVLDFSECLEHHGLSVIAEIKRKSPSSGFIKPDIDPVQIANEYCENGATAISVLTDREFFGGTLKDLQLVKETISIPVLRKDFIISEYQVYESYFAGADAILLIAAVLEPERLLFLYHEAINLGMSVLVEVSSSSQLELIEPLKPQIMGVNSRNLTNMKTDLNRCKNIFPLLPQSCIKVAESGISSIDDLRFIAEIGFDAVLLGTLLMKSKSPGIALRNIISGLIL